MVRGDIQTVGKINVIMMLGGGGLGLDTNCYTNNGSKYGLQPMNGRS